MIRVSLLLAVGLNLIAWGLAAWFVTPRLSNPFLALHYTVYFGVDRIGPPWRMILGPLLGSGILALNYALAVHWYLRDRLASAFMMALALFLEALIVVSTFLTILLNS